MAKNLKLKLARVERDLTQGDLAEAVGVTRQTIGLIEAGKYNPSLSLCQSICRCLGKTLDQLFGRKKMKNRKKLVIKDERTEKLDGKISGEILLGMCLFLALEIFAKLYIFNLTLLSYLPELLLLIGVGLYAIIRRMYVGIDIRDIVENTGKERILSALGFSIVILLIDIVGNREELVNLLTWKYSLKVLLAVIIYLVGSFSMDRVILYLNRRNQQVWEEEDEK